MENVSLPADDPLRGNHAGDGRADDATAFTGAIPGNEQTRKVRFQMRRGWILRVEKLDFRCVEQRGGMQNARNDFVQQFQRFPEIIHNSGGHRQRDVPWCSCTGGLADFKMSRLTVEGCHRASSSLPKIADSLHKGFATSKQMKLLGNTLPKSGCVG
jgi:hypothetical protein